MKIKLSILLLMLTMVSRAQTNKEDINNLDLNFTNSNPDVASFEKIELNKIKKYTGKADVDVPVFTIKSGNITFPIALSYNTGGIKVDQVASDVGLGWSLSQCVITRNINGGNDFNSVGYNSVPNSGYTFSTQQELNHDVNIRQQRYGKIGYFLNQSLNRHLTVNDRTIDFIPDQYNFYSPEFSTNFFFQNINTPVEINPKGTKITAVKGKQLFDSQLGFRNNDGSVSKCYDFPTQDFFSITLTSKEGIKYIFNDYDLAINFPKSSLGEYYNIGYSALLNPNPAAISAWHISQIEDTNTGKKINFEYDITHSNPWKNVYSLTNGQNDQLERSLQKSYNYMKASESAVYQYPCFYWTQADIDTYNFYENKKADVQKKRLKRIVFDEGTIEYKYNNEGGYVSGIANQREDLFNGDFITQIIVKNNKNEIIKTIDFSYDYFVSNYGVGEFNPDGVFNPYRYKRLKLTAVKENGKPSYKFGYIEDIKLPPVQSFAIDFLGFYNNSADVTSRQQMLSLKPRPKLYYYPNNFEKSLVPFPVPNKTPNIIDGYFNREANEYAKAWSLNKITFPTGGFSEFFYESNQFQFMGENIKGGGVRIQKQTLSDGNVARSIEYIYLNDSGKSSGSLSSMPYFGHPEIKFFNVNVDTRAIPPTATSTTITPDIFHWKIFGKSNVNKDITSGSYVGYSKVVEKEIGNGRIESYFTTNEVQDFKDYILRLYPQDGNVTTSLVSNACMADFIISNSGIESEIFTDNGYKRGQLLEELIYDETNQLLKKSKNEYTDNTYGQYQYIKPVTCPIRSQDENYSLGHLINVVKKYELKNFLKTKETIYQYALGQSQTLEINKDFTYNNNGVIKTEQVTASDGTIKNKFFYANDSELSTEPYMSALVTKNVIGRPVKVEKYRNDVKISEDKTVYANDATTSNLLLPKFLYQQKGENGVGVGLEKKVTYDKYDTKGNILQYTEENKFPVSVIWGYNQTYPIARIMNVNYDAIPANLISTVQQKSNSGTEAELLTALTTLRNSLPSNMMTSITYKPLIGITTTTDEKGHKTTYEYDSLGRLKSVKDNDGKMISQNKYHYRTQN